MTLIRQTEPRVDAVDVDATRRGKLAAATRRWWPVAPVVVIAAAIFAVGRLALIDDAMITLTYARNLAGGGGWGMLPGISANTQTSPLNLLLLGALTWPTGSAVLAAGALWVCTAAGLAVGCCALARRAGRGRWAGSAAALLVVCSPLLVSTIGLETPLAVLGLVWAAVLLHDERWVPLGLVCGLLVATRPDLAVPAAVLVALAGRGWWRAALAAVPVGGAWYVWAWFALGSAVPDTLLLKTTGALWYGRYGFGNALGLYLSVLPAETVVVVGSALGGVVGAVVWVREGGPRRRVAVGLLAPAAGYLAAMTALGPEPHSWYYGPALLPPALLLALVLGSRNVWPAAAAAVVAALVVTVVRPTPWVEAPIAPNWASTSAYVQAAETLPAGVTVASPGEVGALAYASHGRARVVDHFTDPGRADELIARRVTASRGVERWLLELNYAHRRWTAPLPTTGWLTLRESGDGATVNWPVGTPWHPDGTLTLHFAG